MHVQAKDLGVDIAAGRRRTVRVLRARFSTFQRRVVRIRRMARASHRARALYHQAQPQATWGQEVMGLSPTMLQALRRCAMRATGLNLAGMSTTATLACVHGWRKDPASTTVLSQVVAWVNAWRADPRLRHEVQKAWPSVVADLDGPRPWTRVKGPAAALVLTMRRYGWEASRPLGGSSRGSMATHRASYEHGPLPRRIGQGCGRCAMGQGLGALAGVWFAPWRT